MSSNCSENNPSDQTYSEAQPVNNENCEGCGNANDFYTPPEGGKAFELLEGPGIAIEDQSDTKTDRFKISQDSTSNTFQDLYWHDTNEPPVRPSAPVYDYGDSSYDGTAQDGWIRDIQESHGLNPIWKSTKRIGDPASTWSFPVLIQSSVGTSGTDGEDGYFNLELFIESTNPDATPTYGAGGSASTLAQMQAVGWKSANGLSGLAYQWRVSRRWIGENVTFDGNGYPDTGPGPNSAWSAIVRLAGKDGDSYPAPDDGEDGEDGDNGWMMEVAVVSDGATREVLQVVDWIGGTGTKPTAHIDDYVSSSGFTSTISLAKNIKGSAAWSDAAWIQIGTSGVYYRKNTLSVVYLKGIHSITGTTTTIGTLPVGYRPPYGASAPTGLEVDVESDLYGTIKVPDGTIKVDNSGGVTIRAAANTSVGVVFDGISFVVA